MSTEKYVAPARVLLCKSGLEEHDRGVRYIARKLLESGMEVVYIVFHDPQEAARTAVDEDVELIGISTSAGGHLAVVQSVVDELEALGSDDVPIIIGGIIPDADHGTLRELGVRGIFGPGTDTDAVITQVAELVLSNRDRRD